MGATPWNTRSGGTALTAMGWSRSTSSACAASWEIMPDNRSGLPASTVSVTVSSAMILFRQPWRKVLPPDKAIPSQLQNKLPVCLIITEHYSRWIAKTSPTRKHSAIPRLSSFLYRSHSNRSQVIYTRIGDISFFGANLTLLLPRPTSPDPNITSQICVSYDSALRSSPAGTL